MQTLENHKPNYRAVHITAEYNGRRYLLTHATDWHAAEIIALDFVAAFPNARFFTGDVYGSQSVNGNARSFRAAYTN